MKLLRETGKLLKKCKYTLEQYFLGFVLLIVMVLLSVFLIQAFLKYVPFHKLLIGDVFVNYTSFISGLLLFLLFIWFGRSFFRASQQQAVHTIFLKAISPWSWYRISFYVIALISIIFIYFSPSFDIWHRIGGALILVTLLFSYVLLWLISYIRKPELLNSTFIYGHSTVGASNSDEYDGDLLGFNKSAAGVRDALDKGLRDPVSVFAIIGGMGTGKSTYWRVIAEGFNKSKKLHTYISLTETNSENDFSKLFAERWFETLSQRYPILFSLSYTKHQRLYNVLRDLNGGFLKDVLSILTLVNEGIFKTRTSYFESDTESRKKFASSTISRMFNYIPHIYEDQWFIVIDEMERAPFDEVYRVIEIIERFKQQAKAGFPVRITFVLCVDQDRLNALLVQHRALSEKSSLIEDFISGSAKNIDFKVTIPIQDTNEKITFVKKKILGMLPKNVTNNATSKMLEDIFDKEKQDLRPIQHVYIGNEGLTDHYERYSYIVHQLINEPPRLAIKSIRQTRFQIEAFLEDSKSWVYNHRVSEYVIFSYLLTKIEGSLIEIAKEVFAQLGPDEPTRQFHEISDPIMMGFDEEVNGEKKINIRKRLYEQYGFDYRYLRDDTELLLKLDPLRVFIPKVYKKILASDDPTLNDETQYEGTLSERSLFVSLVNFRDEVDPSSDYLGFFNKIHNEKTWPKELDTAKQIDDFSGFIRNRINFQRRTREDSYFIAYNILKYILTTDEALFEPGNPNPDANKLDELTYEFIFQLTSSFSQTDEGDEINDKCVDLIRQFFKSKKVTFEAKLIFLDSFLHEQGSGFERAQIREKVLDPKLGLLFLPNLFETMQQDMFKRYGRSRGSKTLYNSEANIFYVLYQTWDGKSEATSDSNLGKLRAIAHKGLKYGAYGLETLWSVYPYEPSWTKYDDFRNDHSQSIVFTPESRGRFIKLRKLLEYSEKNPQFRKLLAGDAALQDKLDFWRNVAEDPKFKKDEERNEENAVTIAVKIERLKKRSQNSGNNSTV